MADDKTAPSRSLDGSSDVVASSNSIKSPNRDSFSELTLLMKAKKPYAFDPGSTKRPPPPPPPPPTRKESDGPYRAIDSENKFCPPLKPANVPETVAQFLQQQELSASSASQVELARRFRPEKTTEVWDTTNTASIHKRDEPLIQLENPAPHNDEKEFAILNEHVMILERNVLALTKSNDALREAKADAESKSDKLKHQNEISKDQTSAISQFLAEKEKLIQDQQQDIENLERKLEIKLRGIANVEAYNEDLEDTIEELTRERDEAVQANANAQHYKSKLKDLSDTVTKQKKIITELRQELVEVNLKNANLEDDILDLKRSSNEVELADLKAKIRQKTIECDRQRHQLKIVEAQLQHCHDRLQDITKNGVSLQGAVHLVKPSVQTQLPKAIVACSECYANNLTCDSNVTCRNCTERDKSCARWRCSLKHKLGNCPLSPCKFPHDSQGWLVLRIERPEW